MKLNRIIIENFRSIEHAEIRLTPKCRVLVGVNESGKSNVLRALALLDPNTKPQPEDLRESTSHEKPVNAGEVIFAFGLESDDYDDIQELLSTKIVGDVNAPIVVVNGKTLSIAEYLKTFKETIYRVFIQDKRRIWSTWKRTHKGSIVPGWLKTTKTASAGESPVPSLQGFDLVNPQSRKLPEDVVANEANFEKLTVEGIADIIVKAINEVAKPELPQCVFWEYKDASLLPSSIDMESFIANPDACLPMKHMFALAGYPNVTSVFEAAKKRPNGTRNLLRRVSEQSTEHLRKVWKEHGGLKLQLVENGANIDAYVEDTYNAYSLNRRSDGFKRFVTFLLLVSVKAKTSELENTLYLHDEPEISLHPSGARYLRDELIAVSSNNYVVYSTHSIFMIDREDIGRHLIVEKKNEKTTVREVDESNIMDEEVLFNALGHSIFEHLKAKNIIFEGWRDKQLFSFATKTLPASHKAYKKALAGIGFCHAKGVKDVSRISPLLELAGRDFIVISDSDAPAREQQRLYNGAGEWVRYDELNGDAGIKTAEDFLKADAFKSSLAKARKSHPALCELPLADLEGNDKIVTLQRWLESGGLDREQTKESLNLIKTEVFGSLKSANISQSYYDLIPKILERLGIAF